MKLDEILTMGGPYMILISVLASVMLIVAVWKIVLIVHKKRFNFNFLDLILLFGSVALAVGILSQIIGFTQGLAAIRDAGDISPSLLYSGAIISFYAPIYGFIVFIISLFLYFILKEVIRHKLPQ